MSTALLTSTVIHSMAPGFSVTDLIRTADTFKQSGQMDAVESLYATWIRHNPQHPLLHAVLFNYGVTLTDAGQLEAARDAFLRAIALDASFMPAHINLGRVYERMGKVGLALVQWSAALARMAEVNGTAITHKTTALNQSARTLETATQDEAAENMLRQSLELDRHQPEVIQHLIALRQRQCEWPVLFGSERFDERTLLEGISPLSAAALTDDPIFQLASAWHYNKTDVGTPAGAMTAWPKADSHTETLRIGYLSSDLREHAVGYLMTEVLGLHDRSRVEVFAYYCGPAATDALHAHFRDTADHFVSITDLDDATAARRIVDDGIQILIDLNGYTREARLKLIALRPAPVIVNWLGFPGSMASPYHHYILADDWIIPESHEIHYSEKVLRLPCYQPSNRGRAIAVQPTRAEAGLPEDAIVYCCFNGAHKITRFTFDRWLSILGRVPKSVLWLLGSAEATNERLRAYATGQGIAPERLVFAPKLANAAHLARYPLADLFLDTTPYGAHTTASDALWMGVPVLTFSGRSFASRVCGSLVRAAGTPELVCLSGSEFMERAVALGNDPAQLAALRERLQAARTFSTLFDMPRLVSSLEHLYRQMWDEYLAGQRPRPDLANLDVYREIGCEFKHEEIEVQEVPGYSDWWAERIVERHRFRPIESDRRLVTPQEPAKKLSTVGN